jgi:hypothetical protein
MPKERSPTNFFAFTGGAWVMGALRFSAFNVDDPTPKLAVAVLDESASDARAEMGTSRIEDSNTSSKPGM